MDKFADDAAQALGLEKKWKKVDTGNTPTWNYREDRVLEGVYKGSHVATTKYGEKNIYDVEKQSGETVGVWETAQIRNFFSRLPVESEVRIEFIKKDFTKGGQPVNVFEFAVAA